MTVGVIDDYLAQIDGAPSSPPSGGGGSRQSAGSGFVYMGKVRVSTPRRVQVPVRPNTNNRMRVDDDETDRARTQTAIRGRTNTEADNVAEIDAVRGQVFEWYGTDDFAKWGRHLLSLGLVSEEDVSNIEVLDEAWQDSLEMAGRMYSSGKRITPWEAARLLASGSGGGRYGGSGAGGRGGGGAAEGPFTGRKRSTSTSVDLTDPATAKALLADTLAQKLGRAPNEDELASFTAVLNSAERANPTTTVTDTDYVEGAATNQSSTTSGGLTGASRQQMAADEAMKKPEYGAFQAATTYYNAMVAALGSPV